MRKVFVYVGWALLPVQIAVGAVVVDQTVFVIVAAATLATHRSANGFRLLVLVTVPGVRQIADRRTRK